MTSIKINLYLIYMQCYLMCNLIVRPTWKIWKALFYFICIFVLLNLFVLSKIYIN